MEQEKGTGGHDRLEPVDMPYISNGAHVCVILASVHTGRSVTETIVIALFYLIFNKK